MALASNYGYDNIGRLNSLTYTQGGATFADYGLTYYANNLLHTFTNSVDSTDNVTYAYDNAGQLLTADRPGTSNDESYTYDANGNRAHATNVSGDFDYSVYKNQITSDGIYNYEYDAEGNMIRRTVIDDSSSYTIFTYDQRNRLVSETDYYGGGEGRQTTYLYDPFDRLIGSKIDQGTSWTQAYIYDGNQVVLLLQGTPGTPQNETNLTDRYLWGPAVDMLLAYEDVWAYGSTPLSSPWVDWAATDYQNSVRVFVHRNSGTGIATVDGGVPYDAFGINFSGQSLGVIAYTGRYFDINTALQWNGERWYNPWIGRWMSQDPIGFNGDPSNPYRYVNNSPTNFVDPAGTDRRVCAFFSHIFIEVRDPTTGTTKELHFGPGSPTQYLVCSPTGLPVVCGPWTKSSPAEDQKLINQWNALEKKRRGGTEPSYSLPGNHCWVPVITYFSCGMQPPPSPPPPPPPPPIPPNGWGWNPL